MAYIRERKAGKKRFTVNYQHEITGGGCRDSFYCLDDAMTLVWRVESSANTLRTREDAIAAVRRWPLQKVVWFWLGYQHDRLNRHRISVASYRRYSQELLSMSPDLLSVAVSKITPRFISLNLTASAQRLLRSAFVLLRRDHMLMFNPVGMINASESRAANAPDKKTIIALLEDAPLREKIAIWLGAVCGLRIGEVVALTYRDISSAGIMVQRHLTSAGMIPGTKRGKGRPLGMPPELCALLDKSLFGKNVPVLVGPGGRHLSLNYGRSGIMKRLLKKHGIGRFHDLRHFAISNFIEHGASLTEAMEFAGHSDPSVTLKVYGHLLRKPRPLEGMLTDD